MDTAKGGTAPESNLFEDLLEHVSIRNGNVMAATVSFSIAAAILVVSFAVILLDVPLQTEKDIVYAIVKAMAYLSLIYVAFKALHRFIVGVVFKKEAEREATGAGEDAKPVPASERRRDRRTKPEEQQATQV